MDSEEDEEDEDEEKMEDRCCIVAPGIMVVKLPGLCQPD
jgi:hypothetical protein